MNRLLCCLMILTTFLSAIPTGFSKPVRSRHATIKYDDGNKYIGEIRKDLVSSQEGILFKRKLKLRHGKGIMYFLNGDQLKGEWENDQCIQGIYKFINGDAFEGKISEYHIEKGELIFSSTEGVITFVNSGNIMLGGYQRWHYPTQCRFDGMIKNKKPYTGKFDSVLRSDRGDIFIGKLCNGFIDSGKLEYVNGDIFEGSFINNAPSIGKYYYKNATTIEMNEYKWHIPAGCIFDGDVTSFTGIVNVEISNDMGDKFIGALYQGAPNEGTMYFVASKHTETGKWIEGLSPLEYKAKLKFEAEAKKAQKEKEEREEAQRVAQEKERQKQMELRKKTILQKYGQKWGTLILNGEIEIGMTQQMCQEIIDRKNYDIEKRYYAGHIIETWTFNKDKQENQVMKNLLHTPKEDALAIAFAWGFADMFGLTSPKYFILIFCDGKLTNIY